MTPKLIDQENIPKLTERSNFKRYNLIYKPQLDQRVASSNFPRSKRKSIIHGEQEPSRIIKLQKPMSDDASAMGFFTCFWD